MSLIPLTGARLTRDGSFTIGNGGLLVTDAGYPVLGSDGRPIAVQRNNVRIDDQGRVFANQRYLDQPDRLVQMRENEWDQTVQIATLQLTSVDQPRYLAKEGGNLLAETELSGERLPLLDDLRPTVRQGFLEKANVNPVVEMTKMIEVNRAYEANQKVVQTHDQNTARLISEVMRAQ